MNSVFRFALWAHLGVGLAHCAGARPETGTTSANGASLGAPAPTEPAPVGSTANSVPTVDAQTGHDAARNAPPQTAQGPHWTVHVVDLGTGLGIFVEGPDFALVYDAGSLEDTARGPENRFVAYLQSVTPKRRRIDHVILSHPAKDHVNLLPDVFARFEVGHFWEPGLPSDECAYQEVLRAVHEKGIDTHSSMQKKGHRYVGFRKPCREKVWGYSFANNDPIETGLRVRLGADASMTFLYAYPLKQPDPKDNSLVMRLDLGSRRVLIMGDVGAGGRDEPSAAPKKGSVEAELLRTKADVPSDILVVANHGSSSSSRQALLERIRPKASILSSGPTPYGELRLPDAGVVSALARLGPVFRTDLHDATCGQQQRKTGPGADGKPGGCDNVRITIEGDGEPAVAYAPQEAP